LTRGLAGGTVSPVTGETDTRRDDVPAGEPAAGDLPAGVFGVWLDRMRAALRHEADADVPCGDCCACCSTSHFVHIGPDEVETLAEVPGELLFAAPGLPNGHVVLPFDERGRCPLLDDGGRCTIYAHRPLTCRTYDCRVFAAAGLDADREEISARARRWRFTCPALADQQALAAVAVAGRWIPAHAAAFPGGAVPDDPAQLAVLAVRVADAFLRGGPAASVSGDEAVAAIIVALAAEDAGPARPRDAVS
jgi:Fe-S-cluster containining protein